jgi:hypothetical protein
MLAAHLLASRPGGDDAGGALFRGARALPDVMSLQAWLEAAWAAGFDPEGAEQLGRCVQRSDTWVGATDCAALLRSFGLRARVVDFRPAGAPPPRGAGAQQGQQRPRPAPALVQQTLGVALGVKRPAPEAPHAPPRAPAVHPGVEVRCVACLLNTCMLVLWAESARALSRACLPQCDVCGQCPVRGARFTSSTRSNYDLCAACAALPDAAAHGPYTRRDAPDIPASASAGAGAGRYAGGGDADDGGATATALVAWVWRYFTTDAAGAPLPARLGEQVAVSAKPPLFFQHDGHSRTIVGVERRRAAPGAPEEALLLVLDPSTEPRALGGALRRRAGWERMVKRGAATLRKRVRAARALR